MTEQILVAGVGNIFLGDDGFGPEVVGHLARSDTPLPSGVRLVDYGIRGIHLAYDLLAGYRTLIIVDARPGTGEPGEVLVLEIGAGDVAGGEFDAHGMDPVAVLARLPDLGGSLPPTYLVGCRPATVADGIGLSDVVQDAVPVAAQAVRSLVAELLEADSPVGSAQPLGRR